MSAQKYFLYYMGSLNGDIRLFRHVWHFIKEYLDEGPATIFSAGNFGLHNPRFLDEVSSEIRDYLTIHVAGGNAAKEGWDTEPPPETGSREIRPGIFVHAFGSCIRVRGCNILFAGHGQALPEDFLPCPKNSSYDARPKQEQVARALDAVNCYAPDVIVSHAFPEFPTRYLLKNLAQNDLRRKRAADPIIPVLNQIEQARLMKNNRKIWWFGGALNVQGRVKRNEQLEYVSLCSFIMVRASLASLEIMTPDPALPKKCQLGNLVYA